MNPKSQAQVATGSVFGAWRTAVANSNATADSASVLLNPTASTAATRLDIPEGATRVLLRQRVASSGVTVSTLCVCIPIALDINGVPIRLDSATLAATGLTLPLDSTLASNYIGADMSAVYAQSDTSPGGNTSAYRYGMPVSLTAYDMQGARWLYVLRATASAHTGGATNPTIEVLFLN